MIGLVEADSLNCLIIPMEIVSTMNPCSIESWLPLIIPMGMPIGCNHYENPKHGQEMLASMMEDAKTMGGSKLKILQKMHALKTFVFPRID
jgi:hypothetical protein